MTRPEVSVVMGVFNSAGTLPATVESILGQEDVDLEFIVVDDGSTDASAAILSGYAAQDSRLRLIRQSHAGLTAALINGCQRALGEFIAREDAGGDYSLPGRLSRQVAFLRSRPEVVMTACGTQWLGPDGEKLWIDVQSARELHSRVGATSFDLIGGPTHHGAVMFRTAAYHRVGGYRAAFVVAQDLDLWSRLAEVGDCAATPDIDYVARIARSAISALHRDVQVRAARVIARCAQARRAGRDDTPVLRDLPAPKAPSRLLLLGRRRDAALFYFIASVLRLQEPERAKGYYCRALTCWPFHLRAWARLFLLVAVPAKGRRPGVRQA